MARTLHEKEAREMKGEWERTRAFVRSAIDNKTYDLLDRTVIVMPEATALFTKERLRLIRLIKQKSPKSIKSLSALAKRDVAAVDRDIKILSLHGVVRLRRIGKGLAPLVERDMILMPLFPRLKTTAHCETSPLKAIA
jgi:predicted transcriptional regulator